MRLLLLFLARQESFKNFMMRFRFFQDTAWRFVAGETLQDATRAARVVNGAGMRASLDLLGENVLARDDASKAVRQVLEMLDTIQTEQVDCNVSIKLSQLGLDLDKEFCHQNLREIVQHAARSKNFIRVDMEQSKYTQPTLDLVRRVHREYENVGAVIQSYLHRSEQDVRELLEEGLRIRLCKGAYLEPPSVAYEKKRDTDANYVKLMKMLLDSPQYHGIATHDRAMLDATKEYARERNIGPEHFEFQMLYGVRRDLQRSLTREGYNMRVYIPYGRQWYPYFMRRLAERPANLLFILRNLFQD